MKKIGFALLAMLLITSCSQAQSQNDFYGKWVWQNEGTMEYTISGKTLTSVWTPSWVTYVTPVEQNTFEIFSWEKITNDNKDTKNDYPAGFLLGLRHGLGNTTSKLFMHRDKNNFIFVYEDKDGYHQEVYLKPCPQSDFYGTWKRVDGDKTFTLTDKEYIDSKSYEITSYKNIINKDNDTKSDYPTGFLIRIDNAFIIDGKNYYLEEEYYLHKNKKNLLKISTFGGSKLLYIKIK